MKKIILLFLSAIFMNMTQAQLYDVIADRDNSKMFRGFITESILKTDSSCKWYSEAQDIYTPKEKVVSTVKQNKDSISFLIFLGTWCEDSHYVVPRIMKILDAAAFPKDKITFVAVDRNKKDLTHLAETLHITNVPTIIAYKNGKELGRVVEYGATGRFDEEVAALLTPKK